MMPILMRDRTNNNGSNHLLDQKIVVYTLGGIMYYKWNAAECEIADWESEI